MPQKGTRLRSSIHLIRYSIGHLRVPLFFLDSFPLMTEPAEPIRLSKRMSELGLASRREADVWIERGWIRIDGVLAVLGQKVVPTQQITVDRAANAEQAARVTVLINKPMGFVSGQAEDG